MTPKVKNYSVKMKKYYFCNGTHNPISHRTKKLLKRWKMFRCAMKIDRLYHLNSSKWRIFMHDILGADEHIIAEETFTPEIGYFWLKSKYKLTNKRIISSAPNSFLGVIPSGRRERSLPLNNISSVMTSYEFQFGRFIIGWFSITMGLLTARYLIGWSIFLVGLKYAFSPYHTFFGVVNNAGQLTTHRISNLEKKKAQSFATEINKVITDSK